MKNKESTDLADYGPKFQKSLMRILFYDRLFCDQISEIMPYDFFTGEAERFYYRSLLDFKKKWKTHPTNSAFDKNILAMVKKEVGKDKEKRKELLEYWEEMQSAEREQSGDEMTKEVALEFCHRQHLKKSLIESSKMISKQETVDKIKDFLMGEFKKGSDNNLGSSILEDFDMVFEEDFRETIAYPWPEINKITNGGIGRGELGVFVASTGGGKSHILVDCATAAYQAGLNVIYYTFELSESVVLKRIYSNLMSTHIDLLKPAKKRIYKEIIKVKDKHDNFLHVKKWPDKVKSPNDIRNSLYKVETLFGKRPDLILVDYADNLKADKADREYRYEINNVYVELRNIANEFNAGLLTASQANRTADNLPILTPKHIAEAYAKFFPVDFAMTIGRTAEDKSNGLGNLNIVKNRNGFDHETYLSKISGTQSQFRIIKKLTDFEVKALLEKAKEQTGGNKK
jgi:KaiC/GvpD/RAD55 family RecA-like ATPase